MIISNFGNNFNYELEKLSRLFLPFEKITVVNDFQQNENRYAVTKTEFNDNGCFISAFLSLDGKDANEECFFEKTGTDFIKECELCLARLLFNCFVKLTEYKPAFGILTGVRPTRLFLSTADKLGSIDNSCDYFKSVLLVDDKKINLLKQTAVSEESIIKKSDLNSYSLYLSIPFCPSRCSYCSFVSHSVEKAQYLIDDYIDYLIKELHETSWIAENLGLKLETVYIDGGTPTILSPVQLDKLLSALNKYFPLSNVREFTVEAGRPDTVTKEKLAVLKEYGVTRISINPQTLNDNVLINIGRKHTKEDFYNAFNLAQKMSFDNINTDLIAGLPTEQRFEARADYKTNTLTTVAKDNLIAEPISSIQVGALPRPNGELSTSQAFRIYSADAKSVTLKGCGGGAGGKTGLYAIPTPECFRVKEATKQGYVDIEVGGALI